MQIIKIQFEKVAQKIKNIYTQLKNCAMLLKSLFNDYKLFFNKFIDLFMNFNIDIFSHLIIYFLSQNSLFNILTLNNEVIYIFDVIFEVIYFHKVNVIIHFDKVS
jgi:hypothetical protein